MPYSLRPLILDVSFVGWTIETVVLGSSELAKSTTYPPVPTQVVVS